MEEEIAAERAEQETLLDSYCSAREGRLIRPFCFLLLYRYLLHYGLLLHIMSQYLWLFSLIL